MSFNGMIVASVNAFSKEGKTTDKNSKQNVILNIVAGKCPNRNVISGTVAENIGIEIGKTYLLSITEGQEDPQYGRQFVYNKLKELTAMEIVTAAKEMYKAEIFKLEAASAAQPAASFGKE